MIKGVKGIFIIIAFLVIGNIISHFTYNFIPGNVIGMVIMFVSLQFGLIDGKSVERIANFLTKNMALFFVPAGIGLLASYKLLGQYWLSITLASVISTLLVLATVALIQEKFGKK